MEKHRQQRNSGNVAGVVELAFTRAIDMNDRLLFRKLLQHSLMGAALGGVFSSVVLAFNIHHALDVVHSSAAPWTLMIILTAGSCLYFAFGAAITGFHFVIMEGDPGPLR